MSVVISRSPVDQDKRRSVRGANNRSADNYRKVDQAMSTCTPCKGRGSVDCPKCKGKGRVSTWGGGGEPCSHCGGTGQVECNVRGGSGRK